MSIGTAGSLIREVSWEDGRLTREVSWEDGRLTREVSWENRRLVRMRRRGAAGLE